jgi:gluconate 2-dehydrogenase gamma chain
VAELCPPVPRPPLIAARVAHPVKVDAHRPARWEWRDAASREPDMKSPARRSLLKAAVLSPVAAVVPLRFVANVREAQAAPPRYTSPPEQYFKKQEVAFVDAAVSRIIPNDELGPGAKEAGVTTFIDSQLAGPYGRAETWYMQGPWKKGTDQQGYQLKLTPAQLYRAAIRDIDDYARRTYGNKPFAELGSDVQDKVLQGLEKGDIDLPNAPAKTFFTMLIENTVEGFLADPVYGGNRDFAGWKLIGFPGPRYNYIAEIEQYGKKYDAPFVSIAGKDSAIKET